MLRLPPTRITLDASDIERHAISGKKVIERMNEKGVGQKRIFGYPFPPRPKSQSAAVQELISGTNTVPEAPEPSRRVNDQSFNDTIYVRKNGNPSDDTPDRWTSPEPANLAPIQHNTQGLESPATCRFY